MQQSQTLLQHPLRRADLARHGKHGGKLKIGRSSNTQWLLQSRLRHIALGWKSPVPSNGRRLITSTWGGQQTTGSNRPRPICATCVNAPQTPRRTSRANFGASVGTDIYLASWMRSHNRCRGPVWCSKIGSRPIRAICPSVARTSIPLGTCYAKWGGFTQEHPLPATRPIRPFG